MRLPQSCYSVGGIDPVWQRSRYRSCYFGLRRKLKVWIISVANMKKVDMTGKNDPYCICLHGHKEIFRTATKQDAGVNCTWDHGPEEIEYW